MKLKASFPLKKTLVCLVALSATSCSRQYMESLYDMDYTTLSKFATNLAPLPGQYKKDLGELEDLIGLFTGDIENKWGKEEVKVSGKKVYVKYTEDYLNRSEVNFEEGLIRIETVATSDAATHLRQAIITTLLTPNNPADVDLFSSKDVDLGGAPFLLGQVLDQDGQIIKWNWRASRYADYLLKNHLKQRRVDFKTSYYVDIPMAKDHEAIRSYQYADIVRRASIKYDISEQLIYAIIKTESSFNPYAVSWANAYGLMQVVPKTAGADVFKLVKKRSGIPTPEYLFDPENNIDTGTAYFYLLKNRYLKGIANPTSLEYSMISAYNGGSTGVYKAFNGSNLTNSIPKINSYTPNQVYYVLTKKHNNAEARRYLEKVVNFKKDFHKL